MSERQTKNEGDHFIAEDLRPTLAIRLGDYPPFSPTAPPAEFAERVRAIAGSGAAADPLMVDACLSSAEWAAKPRHSLEVHASELGEDVVLVNLGTGKYYTLNRVGAVIWGLCAGDRSVEDILMEICRRFEVTAQVARGDLEALIFALTREGLIQSAS